MPTVSVNLDTTQYVKVNTAFNPLLLQAHRDDVRVVLSELKPSRGNTIFHLLGGDDAPLHFPSIDVNVWALAITDKSSLIVSELDPVHVALHDGDNNPLSSYAHPVTGEHVLDIHDADVHNRAVNKYLHQHSATSTTVFTASAINDFALNVADTAGFIVGNALHINTGSAESTHPIITVITPGTPGVLTLDRRLDNAHAVGDIVTLSIIDLASQIGTLATPQIYWAGPEPGDIWHITTLTLAMGHTSAGDLGLFGNQTAFTNGVGLRARISGNYGTLSNWKNNGDIDVDTGSVRFPLRSGGGGTYGTSADGPFKFRTGSVMRLVGDNGDRFELYVQDDPTGLNFWNMKVQGHFEDG